MSPPFAFVLFNAYDDPRDTISVEINKAKRQTMPSTPFYQEYTFHARMSHM
jgi:hypothetical protein